MQRLRGVADERRARANARRGTRELEWIGGAAACAHEASGAPAEAPLQLVEERRHRQLQNLRARDCGVTVHTTVKLPSAAAARQAGRRALKRSKARAVVGPVGADIDDERDLTVILYTRLDARARARSECAPSAAPHESRREALDRAVAQRQA